MHESIAYSKNFLNNTLVTKKKIKDDSMVKGITTIELYNKDGNIEQKVVSENAFNVTFLKNMMRVNLLAPTPYWGLEDYFTYNRQAHPFSRFYVSNNPDAEDPNRYIPTDSDKKLLGFANTWQTYSGSSTTQGTINYSESLFGVPDLVNKKVKYHYVFDFPTQACNGTIKKVGFDNPPMGNSRNDSMVHYLITANDTMYSLINRNLFFSSNPVSNAIRKIGNYYVTCCNEGKTICYNTPENIANNIQCKTIDLTGISYSYKFYNTIIMTIKDSEEKDHYFYVEAYNNGSNGVVAYQLDFENSKVDKTPCLFYTEDGTAVKQRASNVGLISYYKNENDEDAILCALKDKCCLYDIIIKDISLAESEHKIIIDRTFNDTSVKSIFNEYTYFIYGGGKTCDINYESQYTNLQKFNFKGETIYTAGRSVYALTDSKKLRMLSYSYSDRDSRAFLNIPMEDDLMMMRRSGDNIDFSYATYGVSTENLLPEPIVKSDQNTMKIKYDIEIDM